MQADELAAVLVSVKPQYAEAIASGSKTVELRRRFPLNVAGLWLVLYATKPVGAIVGRARIEAIHTGDPDDLWISHGASSGVSQDAFFEYFEGVATGIAIELASFERVAYNSELIEGDSPQIRPPQSYRYLTASLLRGLIATHYEEATTSDAGP